MAGKELVRLNNLSKTLFFPLYCRAIESKRKNPILKDEKAVEIVNILDKYFSKTNSDFYEMLLQQKLPKTYIKKINLLTKKFDEYAINFLLKKPNGIIVNMGCGLDTRFNRINKKVEFYDLDLPEVIELKKQFLEENNYYHFISSSLLDFRWIDSLSKNKNQTFMFLAQGIFSYLRENDVKSLIFELQKKFPGCEIVFDVVNSYYVKKLKRDKIKKRFQQRYNLGKDVSYNFGIKESNDLENWGEGIAFVDEWYFYKDSSYKLKFHILDRILESLNKPRWIVHYKLN